MKVVRHEVTPDWCHLCGKRQIELADIRYPHNAAHETVNSEFIRVCYHCARLIADTARGFGEE